MAELLTVDDPLLPRLRAAAERDRGAFTWLMESAKRWALGEFLDRELREEDGEPVAYALRTLVNHQVAVRVDESQPFSKPPVRRHVIRVGLLCHESEEYESEGCYLKLKLDDKDHFAGIVKIADVVELHSAFRLPTWPVTLRGT